jgi:hypothetical protein
MIFATAEQTRLFLSIVVLERLRVPIDLEHPSFDVVVGSLPFAVEPGLIILRWSLVSNGSRTSTHLFPDSDNFLEFLSKVAHSPRRG